MFLLSAPAELEWLSNQSFTEDVLKTHRRATERVQAEEPAGTRSSDPIKRSAVIDYKFTLSPVRNLMCD